MTVKCCVPGCFTMQTKGEENHLSLHIFPHPGKDKERFMVWVSAIKGNFANMTEDFIYRNRRICTKHFENKYLCSNNRLSNIAIPTLQLLSLEEREEQKPELSFTPTATLDLSCQSMQNIQKKSYHLTASEEREEQQPQLSFTPTATLDLSCQSMQNIQKKSYHLTDDESDDQSQSVSGVSSDEEIQQYSEEKTTEFPTRYQCYACEEDILGFRYTCVQCVSCSLCEHCEALREHADHYMLRIPSGKRDTEIERVLDRIRLDLNIIQQPKKEPEDNKEKSCIIMEALEIKQDPLPYTYPAEDIHMMVPGPVPRQLLLKPKKCYTRKVPKRKQTTKEDNTELQPKASRISQSTVDESIADTAYSDNKKIKIEIKEEPIDTEHDNSSASSQVAASSSSSVVPVSYTEVPRVKLEPNEIEVTDIKGFNPSPLRL